ncbi:3-carboxy-cis,cis-muconate lactonizing protein, partial [Anabaena minutissima FACHB-250]|nr:3-carboxy-cis,cis-muconate lactonizing protein [Anabaena minutissima FACHB-250]
TPTAIATNGTQTFVSSLGITGNNGGLAVFNTNTLLPDAVTLLTTFDNIEALEVSTANGEDIITLRQAPSPEVVTTTINTGDGDDSVILQALSPNTIVNLGAGNDTAQLRADTASSNLTVRGEGGDDTINIERVGEFSRTEVFGGDDRDTVRVSGTNLPTSATTIAHGDDPNDVPQSQGDTLIFDPQNPNPDIPNFTPAPPNPREGNVNVINKGTLQYDTFEGDVIVINAPIIEFTGQPYQIAEGESVTFSIKVNPLGLKNELREVAWDIDGDGRFGEVSGETITLNWQQLVDLGLGDDGTYQIGVRATNADDLSSNALTTLLIVNTPPTIQVSGVNEIAVGSTYTINFSASDPGEDRVFEWRIDWGDGTPMEILGSNTTSATHIYTNPGKAQIIVGAVDEDSAPNATFAAPKNISITVSANQVSAGSPYTIAEGEALTLNAIAIGTPTEYLWDINGDSIFTDATGQNPTLTWTQLQQLAANPIQNNGTFNVRVRVNYGIDQQATSNAVTLRVSNTAPTARLINGGPVNEGDTATVSFLDQFDPSQSDTDAGFLYSYDFDGDGKFEIEDSISNSVVVPSQYLSDNGTRSIRGVIKDQDGGATELFTEITVLEVAPTLIISGADTAIEGASYTLNLSGTDPGNDTVNQWIVDWNDGTIETFAGDTQSLTHQFTDNGTRVILVTAIDEDGTYTATKTVTVSNAAPQLQNLSATTAIEGSISHLTGRIVDPGIEDSFVLVVDWGDGSSETFNLAAGTTDFDFGHRYEDNGDYKINVKVTDKDGASDTEETIARVNNAAPAISSLVLADPTVPESGLVVVTGRITDAGIGDTHTVVIDWGDGFTSAATVDASTRTFTASRRYADDNPTGTAFDDYIITTTVTDNDGDSATASTIVTVTNVAPVITAFQRTETKVNRSNLVSITGGFNDLGLLDTHTVTIDWGNGKTSNTVVDAATGTFTATYEYTVISGDGSRSALNGTSGNDRIFGGLNGKTITGGAGNDEFIYTDLREVGHRIADFEVGKDKINLSQLLDSLVIGGYQGTDAIADGYVRLVQGPTANSTIIQIDRDGEGSAIFRSFLTIDNVGLEAMNNPNNFIYNDVDNYIVNVTVTDDDGGSDTTSTTVSKRI